MTPAPSPQGTTTAPTPSVPSAGRETTRFTGRIEWQCLDCGDHGVKVTGHTALHQRAWQSALNDHNLRNPGCTGGMDALRCREEGDDDRDAKLRAG